MDLVIYVLIGLAYVQGGFMHFRSGDTSDAVRKLVVGLAYIVMAATKLAFLTSMRAAG